MKRFTTTIKHGAVFALVLICAFMFTSSKAKAATLSIRVGLTELFSGQASLTVKNESVSVGYSVNGVYFEETVLKGGSFTFTPAAGFFYVCNTEFPSLEKAKEMADKANAGGAKAYPCAVYKGTWLLYVGGGTKDEAKNLKDIAETATGLGFDVVSGDNGQRVFIKCADTMILEDAGVMGLYLQFAPVTANSAGIEATEVSNTSGRIRNYRGRIEIGRYGKPSLSAVNEIELEEYLYSTVNCEMVTEWPFEAQKAQAVAARSYAVAKAESHPNCTVTDPYQLDDTTNSQVYKGAGFETEKSIAAVKATAGQTVTKDGKTVMAFFFSTSGGATENIKDVWDYDHAYFKSVADPYETDPEVLPWVVALTKDRIREKLAGAGINVGIVTDVAPENITSSGRVNRLKITGTLKTVTLETSQIRTILGFLSTKFSVVKYGDEPSSVFAVTAEGVVGVNLKDSYFTDSYGRAVAAPAIQQYVAVKDGNFEGISAEAPANADTFYFVGMGWGHGVGMSQSGAAGMAKAGYNYKQILEYYYSGCKVK